ncbi:MAG: 3-oxoacyl-[acyl-carrier-protein] reductase FabG [Verrucomicrobia subdivision 3 bacterium]|nr:3-oxoacyl-[acyl-carrier-protein] reductase FabG [Limisphaerales bacterium]MCS1417559.1 3-oxoacyl-[acyl-carrier-protein] reductase FabG [Limisphaerales bacterium]
MSKVAIVTGSSRGIGRGVALSLAEEGFHLVVNYAGNVVAARETARLCEERGREKGHAIRAIEVKADVGDARDRRHLVDETRNEFGGLGLLVNNAGITSIGRADILDATEEAFDRLMAVNLKGPYFLTQAVAAWMIEERERTPELRPKIITISSISGYAVSVDRGDYCMAKAALGMMTKLYAVRLAALGINVYEICPGIIASDMTAPVQDKYDQLIAEGLTPIRRWGAPSDVGRAVVAIASDQFEFSTGEVFNVDGGFHIRQL